MNRRLALSLILALACASAGAQTPAAGATQRLRGAIVSFDGSTLVLKERSGETYNLVARPDLAVNEVLPTELAAIKPNSFVGIASLPGGEGGTLRALEVLVFPESARGSGEGHYPWDLEPGSMMTNATVADVVSVGQGRTLKVRYKDGEQTIVVPPGVPVVTFQPGERSLLVAGAKVLATAQQRDGKLTAVRVLVGRNGFQPPM